MAPAPVKIGIIGCGNISGIYLQADQKFDILQVAACADLLPERAQAKADEFGIRACSIDEILADPSIEIIVNLTVPNVHADVSQAVLAAGKHVYCEKPLATTRDDGLRVLATAEAAGLLVGCAPDTVLGGGIQTCRKLIDDGWIGLPIAATGFMMGSGPEGWHPDPAFFYQFGGGPMFDLGPYYLSALVTLLGPVQRVTASAHITFPERLITSQPRYGTKIQVEVPTHVAGVMDFASGAVGTLITSFDIFGGSMLPRIEVYGTEGTLCVPDPNTFGGPVRLHRTGAENWLETPLSHPYASNSRGLGVADMAYAIRCSRPHRASGKLAYHVLDIMQAFDDASREGRHLVLTSGVSRPDPLPLGLREGLLDLEGGFVA